MSSTRKPTDTAPVAQQVLANLLDVKPSLDHAPDLQMVRLWVNRDGSRTDVVVFMAQGDRIVNLTPHLAAAMGETLHERPAGWALRLSSGGVNPAAILQDYLYRWTGRHVRVFG